MADEKKSTLKEKAQEELRLMLVITAFLAAVFVSFLTYKRILSRRFGVTAFPHGLALIEAVLGANVILIGKAIGIGKTSGGRALFYSALRDSVIYAVLVGVFAILEHIVEGLFHHKTLAASLEEFLSQGVWEILGRTLVVFVAFVPFFTLWELDRSLGERKLMELLFHKDKARARA